MSDNNYSHRPTVLIIGAGIGGLSTGCYLSKNGYDTHIVEMGSCSGGVSVARYRSEKERIARATVQALDKRFSGAAAGVETIDVATPATFIRYTGIWQGSYQSWAPTPSMVGRNLPKTLPGLRNFYMAGQWVWPAGGLPGVIRIGRNIAQIICQRDHRRFIAS